jgi:hypothetical protein
MHGTLECAEYMGKPKKPYLATQVIAQPILQLLFASIATNRYMAQSLKSI